MAIRPAHFFRHVISQDGDDEIVKVHCPHCAGGIYFVVTTILGKGEIAFDVRLNDRECACTIDDQEWDELRKGAIEMPDTGEDDEDYWMAYGLAHPDHDGGPADTGKEMSVEAIRARHAEWIEVFRASTPTEGGGYYQAALDIGWLLDHIESLEDYAHRQDLDHIAQRNEVELLRADNLQRRSEDVYYGRNRRDRDY